MSSLLEAAVRHPFSHAGRALDAHVRFASA
jgi:hypothetical protein